MCIFVAHCSCCIHLVVCSKSDTCSGINNEQRVEILMITLVSSTKSLKPNISASSVVCCFRKDALLVCMGLWDQMGGALLRLRKDMCRKMMSHGCSWYNHYSHYEFRSFLKEHFVIKETKKLGALFNVFTEDIFVC